MSSKRSSTQIGKQAGKQGRPTDLAKREAIVSAAAQSFFDQGYAASSIEKIAASAGVSKVTIYNHFGDKPALFSAAVDAECGKMRSVFSLGSIGSGSLRERMLVLGEAIMDFLSRPEMIQFDRRIAAETEREPEIGIAFLDAGPRRMKATFALFLHGMVGSGELKIENTALAAEQFVSMCKGLGHLERRFGAANDPASNRQRIEGAVEVFLRAYAPDGGSTG